MKDLSSLLIFSTLIFGCRDTENKGNTVIQVDADGDGFFSEQDCNDDNSSIHPDSEEICDGIDNNCNQQTDEGVLQTYYVDSDGDNFGNPNITTEACAQPSGYVSESSDCNDNNDEAHPEATEICDDTDNNCDGAIDEGLAEEFYLDADGDGFGDDTQIIEACQLATGLAAIGGDCADDEPDTNPFTQEECDGVDNNCDGQIDEGVMQIYYDDKDADGYGDAESDVEACLPPEGTVSQADDCDDLESYAHPNAIEVCDEIDNDCDGFIDEANAAGELTFYTDSDNDGFGDPDTGIAACTLPSGYVSNDQDCDDANAATFPNADELCDGIDNNCDGQTDGANAIDQQVWYLDDDGDGFGDISQYSIACTVPTSHSDQSGDCDDANINIHPGATEVCNEEDDDCDNSIDEEAQDAVTYYADDDEDGFGDAGNTLQSCTMPTNYSTDATDCDDNDNDISPGATEVCNEEDDNCDGQIDEGVDITWYLDADEDGFGDATESLESCVQPVDHTLDATDCDDSASELGSTDTDADCDGVLSSEDCDDNNPSIQLFGEQENCPASSCLEIYNEGIATDGLYWVGSETLAGETWCDMGNGGWTLVAHKDTPSIDLTVDSALGTPGEPDVDTSFFKLDTEIIDIVQLHSDFWRITGALSGKSVDVATTGLPGTGMSSNEYRELRYLLSGVGMTGCGPNTWTSGVFYPTDNSIPSPSCWAYPTSTSFYDFKSNPSGTNGNGHTIWLQ